MREEDAWDSMVVDLVGLVKALHFTLWWEPLDGFLSRTLT